MVRRIKNEDTRDWNTGGPIAIKPKRPIGRPRKSGAEATKATVSRGYLNRAAAIVERLLASPRSKAAQADAAELARDLRRRLAPVPSSGDAAQPADRDRVVGYSVGEPDGTITRVATLEQAAELYGVKPKSLAAMLAKRGEGYTRRRRGDQLFWVRRVYASQEGKVAE
jgi:hypothetical protein